MATITKKELLKAIEDMPMDARILMYFEDPEYGGDVLVDEIYIETSIGCRDRGTIMIKEKR